MPLYKFKSNDIFHNTIKTHPKCEFFITSGNVYYNNKLAITGAHVTNAGHTPVGHISLYELNVDRASGSAGYLIYPFVTKDGSQSAFKATSKTGFNSDYGYGDRITGSYPLSASISITLHTASIHPNQTTNPRPRIIALRNTLDHYKAALSPYYDFDKYYSASVAHPGTGLQHGPVINLISIPSIFYGSSIKKGTVDLKFYVSGALIGQLKDEKQDGELIQTGPVGSGGSGSVAGTILYNEGFILLTASYSLNSEVKDYYTSSLNTSDPSWIFFGMTGSFPEEPKLLVDQSGSVVTSGFASASFNISFQGTNYVPTLTMFAHANRGELNHSNNPTFLDYDNTGSHIPITGATQFVERKDIPIKNIVKTPWIEPTGSFTKTTYISKIALYDEKKNLIGIAKLATPVKKTEDKDFTFKLKLDF